MNGAVVNGELTASPTMEESAVAATGVRWGSLGIAVVLGLVVPPLSVPLGDFAIRNYVHIGSGILPNYTPELHGIVGAIAGSQAAPIAFLFAVLALIPGYLLQRLVIALVISISHIAVMYAAIDWMLEGQEMLFNDYLNFFLAAPGLGLIAYLFASQLRMWSRWTLRFGSSTMSNQRFGLAAMMELTLVASVGCLMLELWLSTYRYSLSAVYELILVGIPAIGLSAAVICLLQLFLGNNSTGAIVGISVRMLLIPAIVMAAVLIALRFQEGVDRFIIQLSVGFMPLAHVIAGAIVVAPLGWLCRRGGLRLAVMRKIPTSV